VDLFFNEKNKEGGEYESPPYTLELQAWLSLLKDTLNVRGWFQDDLPLSLTLPQRQSGLSFRYRQLRAGADVSLEVSQDLRFDLELKLERTQKRRIAPGDPDPWGSDRLDRDAMLVVVQFEVDSESLIEGSSLKEDTLFGAWQVHVLDEVTRRPLSPQDKVTERRGETYLEAGYVLGLPSPDEQIGWGLRGTVSAGFLSLRQVGPGKHRVTEKLLAKISAGAEVSVLEDLRATIQFTYRLDTLEFGGGNVQIAMRF
jgi:hypothetical protein